MPLKHHTETALVIVLCAIILLTGVIVSSLPMLPLGLVPWGIVFLATLLYPFALYPLFKRHRADYEFRALHFAPAAITGVWFLLQAASLRSPWLLQFHKWYTWGHSFFPVVVSLVLLAAFCVQVIRRRGVRVGSMVALFLPFVALAAVTENGARVDRTIAAVLWPAQASSSSVTVAVSSAAASQALPSGSGKNLAHSSDIDEEEWRRRLREMANRSSVSSVASSRRSSLPYSSSSSTPPPTAKPVRLPGSGFGMEATLPMFVAGYMGVLHSRARRRRK